jgi:nucleoside-diphosphate-sugar epimerase
MRELLYVEGCAKTVVLATERYNKSGIEMSIRDLVTMITCPAGFRERVAWNASKSNGQPCRCLDATRAEHAFGFTAEVPFIDELRRTVKWYRSYRRAKSGHALPNA